MRIHTIYTIKPIIIFLQRLDSKLTDQQEKIKDGRAPMPLYTCVHVKKDVSAKVFQGNA